MSWRIAGPIAVLILAACTSSPSSDSSIGQPDATTVPTDLATTSSSATFETYLVGDNLYVRSGCPAADPILRGGADGLPNAGQTEQTRVADLVEEHRLSLLAEFEAVDVRVVPRNGQVWTGPGNGEYEVIDAQDFQIEVILSDDSDCPAVPYSWNGIPVLFTLQPLISDVSQEDGP